MTQIDEPRAEATRPAQRVRLTDLDLAVLQVRAIDRFNDYRREAQAAADAASSREARMDANRLRDVLRRQHEALVAHCDEQSMTACKPALSLADRRVVIAHRNEWFSGKVAAGLTELGLRVVATTGSGADAVGVAVAEQPDLMLVEDVLPMTTGVQVVRQVRRFSPGTLVAAQVGYGDGMPPLLDAGAAAVFVRSIPPGDVATRLLELLEESSD